MRNLVQAAGTDAIGAFFVLLNLLKRQAERVSKFLLAQPQHHPAHTDPTPDVLVGRVCRLLCERRWLRMSGHGLIVTTVERGSESKVANRTEGALGRVNPADLGYAVALRPRPRR